MSASIATLCATGLAISSAAVGLSFGALDSPSSSSTPRPPPAPRLPTPRALDDRSARPFDRPLDHRQSMLDASPDDAPDRSSVHSSGRRVSSFHESSADPDPLHVAARPWPFRRSTSHSSPSHHSGRESVTRSHAHSSSSAQPFLFSGLVTPPPAPNKLVKRSYQRDPHSAPPSSFRKIHLKRPATSHQRSASWSMQNADQQLPSPQPLHPDPSQPSKSRHLLEIRSVRKRGSREQDSLTFRHITPSASTPVLLPAAAVAAPDVVYVEELKEPDPARKAPRISSSPLRSVSPASPDPRHLRSAPPSSFPRRPLDHDPPSRKRTSNSSPSSNLMRKLSRRITSAPSFRSRPESMDPHDSGSSTHHHPPGPRQDASDLHGSESDASPPVTPTSIAGRFMQRRTRPSARSSERTSSRPGSEGAPRVFSWIEGGDDDMNSDTVYDSIRTGTTRSTSGPARGGLETLFDQSTASIDVHDNAWPLPDSPATPVFKKPPTHAHTPLLRVPQDDLTGDAHAFADATEDSPSSREAAMPKNSLFDWSEQPALERQSEGGTPPRPKTSQPKKQQLDPRSGGLSTGRRAPSGLHSRSHSVPVLQDLAARQSDASNKFGSWGIGTKVATEAWDNDFEFEELDAPGAPGEGRANEATRHGGSMIVPDKIQQQQSNVLANISLLREWGLLIEELKDLRARATTLGARNEENGDVFDEVDAMIDLADQEAEGGEEAGGVWSPASSSHTFSEDDFEQQLTPPPARGETATQRTRMSPSEMLRVMQRPKGLAKASPRVDSPEAFQRPRQDSEAMARSVIEALQRWRQPGADGEAPSTPPSKRKKVPFDTATLRHIVPHVNALMRKIKQMLRDIEGLNMSPREEETGMDGETALSRAFRQRRAGEESPGAQKEQRLRLKRSTGRARTASEQGEEDERVETHMKGLMID